MAQDLAVADTDDPIDLEEAGSRLDEEGCDLDSDEGIERARQLLVRLSVNRDFLGRAAIAELKDGCEQQQRINMYGAQVLMLHRSPRRHFIRANLWPAADDPVVRASGLSHYFYHVPHDHNFPFLTVGYSGPGYRSRWYEMDYAKVAGFEGEQAGLTLVEDGHLFPGRVLHYRAHRDVHDQHPPDALSVSISIIPESPRAMWQDQYQFDARTMALSAVPTCSQGEVLLRIAVACGDGDGLDIAHEFARKHASHRARWNGWVALLGATNGVAARQALMERAVSDSSPLVSGNARATLERLERGTMAS